MSNTTIQIKRSTTTTVPSSLSQGELAFTSNGDTLWIGSPSGSDAANVIHIGAKISYVGNATHIGATTTGSNSELASTYAIKQFVANQISSFTTTFAGLTDVDVDARANNDLIVYDSASGKWENKTISGTANEIDVSFSNNNVVVGLADNVDIVANVTIGGTANVTGQAHFFDVVHINTDAPAHVVHYITNPTLIATVDTDSYGQVAMQNFNGGANASSDFIAYPNNTAVDDNTGFIDMGITGNGYNQAAYAVTSPNDGYLFASARAGDNLGGSLVLATDSTGTNNDIKFFAGGFTFSANQAHMVLAANTRSFGINNAAPVAKLSVGGDSWLNGNVESQHLLPLANVSYDLGSASLTWRTVYANTVTTANVSATDIYGTVQTSSQPNITSVGTLGTLNVAGNVALGDASADVVSINGSVNTHIVPSANLTYDIGSASKYWNNVYANTGSFTNLTVSGDLTVQGTLTTIDTNELVVEDPMIRLARNQANTGTFTDAVDIGFYGTYGNTSSIVYTGIARDASSNTFVLFDGLDQAPDNVVNTNAITIASLQAYLQSGGLVSNSSVVNITANSSVSVALTANSLSLTTALTVGSGGTGRSSLTNNAIIVGNDTGSVTLLSSSTEGHVLQINSSGAPTFAGLDGGSF